jgi:mannose-6-phosphate isomerase-like protein (cupin superfamily)
MPLPSIDALRAKAGRTGLAYVEFLRVPAMSAGIYVLGAGASDAQLPHTEDEIYYVARGQGRFRSGTEDRPVKEGDILFVPAAVDHRFHSIERELILLVVFAPAEGADSIRPGP